MSEHLGYDKHAVAGRNRGNSRNGRRSKTIVTEAAGEVQIEVPRDREGTLAPVIVAKRQRRLPDLDAVVLSLYAKGLTTGEISAHFAEVYGASVSKDTVSRRSVLVRNRGSSTSSCRPRRSHRRRQNRSLVAATTT